jgi:hypothetical protein
MRKFLLMAIALVLFASAARLTAQGPPEVKPGPEHMKLKDSEGIWDATIKSKDGDSKATLSCKVDLNGLWLLEHFKADLGGTPFEGRGTLSYDPAKKKYVHVWISSMATFPQVSEGTYDATTKTMILVGDMPTPDGKSIKATLTTVMKDADTRTFTIRGAGQDGKDFEMLNITYKRRVK